MARTGTAGAPAAGEATTRGDGHAITARAGVGVSRVSIECRRSIDRVSVSQRSRRTSVTRVSLAIGLAARTVCTSPPRSRRRRRQASATGRRGQRLGALTVSDGRRRAARKRRGRSRRRMPSADRRLVSVMLV
jgi:hypothetical protein